MEKFPLEFSELLTPYGHDILENRNKLCAYFKNSIKYFVPIQDAIDKRKAKKYTKLLDKKLYPLLRTINSRIDPKSISRMKENYSEFLEKTIHVKTTYLTTKSSKSYLMAKKLGVINMMRSRSFLKFAEAITGYELYDDWGCQVLCYDHGHYVGAHNDHHPEDKLGRDGYIDVHVTLSNNAVHHQWMVYEEKGHFSKIINVNTLGGITVYKLPFWHYVTPLAGKLGHEREAHRWVLIGTFDIKNK